MKIYISYIKRNLSHGFKLNLWIVSTSKIESRPLVKHSHIYDTPQRSKLLIYGSHNNKIFPISYSEDHIWPIKVGITSYTLLLLQHICNIYIIDPADKNSFTVRKVAYKRWQCTYVLEDTLVKKRYPMCICVAV